MAGAPTPFLMFQGKAAEALSFYMSVFDRVEVLSMETRKAGIGGSGVQRALISIDGQKLMFFDSPVSHGFGFTPSFSFFIECDSVEEVDRLAGGLSAGGSSLMEAARTEFAERFAWVSDPYGVTWQLHFRGDA